MENLVKYIIDNLVDNTDSVVESAVDNKGYVVITASVNKHDIGRVIGKNGKVAQSIRAIVKTASSKTNNKYIVKIVEKAE